MPESKKEEIHWLFASNCLEIFEHMTNSIIMGWDFKKADGSIIHLDRQGIFNARKELHKQGFD